MIPKLLAREDNIQSCESFSKKKVLRVIKEMGAEKALRPDVSSTLFYKKHWSIIRVNFMQAIHQF